MARDNQKPLNEHFRPARVSQFGIRRLPELTGVRTEAAFFFVDQVLTTATSSTIAEETLRSSGDRLVEDQQGFVEQTCETRQRC